MTNIVLARDPAAKRMFSVRKRSANVAAANVLSVRKRSVSNNKSGSSDAPRKLCSVRKRSVSNKCFICAKAKRQRQMFYLRESEASATNVLSVRKRSDSNNKAPSRNGNQPLVMVMSLLSVNPPYFHYLENIIANTSSLICTFFNNMYRRRRLKWK